MADIYTGQSGMFSTNPLISAGSKQMNPGGGTTPPSMTPGGPQTTGGLGFTGTATDPVISGGSKQINPTGINGGGGTTPPWMSPNPQPVGGPGNYGYGTSGNPNPVGVSTPTTTPPSMTPGGAQTTGGLGFAGTNWESFGNELGKIYGKGVGSELYGFLDTGGGYNSALTQQAVEAQTAEMQRQAQTGYGNLESATGAAGISPNSSVAALESSNYWSNVTTAENAMTSEEYFNMWNQSMNRETSVLGDVLGAAGHYQQQQQSSPLDWAILGLGGASALGDLASTFGLFGG